MVSILYSVFFVTAVFSAILVATLRSAVYCALSLVVTMLSLAGIFLLIKAPFVALIQVLVYAGAIMVLFLYVIMLLNPRVREPVVELVVARRGVGFLLVLMFFLLTAAWLSRVFLQVEEVVSPRAAGVGALAERMLTYYLLPFELLSVLLLVAIVGAVAIAKRG